MKQYRRLLIVIWALCFLQNTYAQNAAKLIKLWETDTIIKTPESVLIDPTRGTLFVSLVDGMSWEADGKGAVAKMSFDGTTVDQEWVTGLNCPKGMGIVGNKLYVADLDEVVVINIKKATIEKRIKPEGAANLNDIATAPKGVVYVSDSKVGRVYKIEKDEATLYMDSLPKVNGLRFMNYEIAMAAGKNFIKVNENKKITPIAELPEVGDGVEPVGNNDWIVSSWVGLLYYVHANGKVDIMLDTRDSKKNIADIGYDMYRKIIYVPTFYAKTVAAYQLVIK